MRSALSWGGEECADRVTTEIENIGSVIRAHICHRTEFIARRRRNNRALSITSMNPCSYAP